MRNEISIILIALVFISGCEETKVVGSLECGEIEIDVLSIKYKRTPGYQQNWGTGIEVDGQRLVIIEEEYAGFLPETFRRTVVGTGRKLEPGHVDFPYDEAFNFYLGEFPDKKRKAIEQCLVKEDSKLRASLLKTKRMKNFPPPSGEFIKRFVYWHAKQTDLRLEFKSGTEDLSPTESGFVFYANEEQFMNVGELQYDNEGKLSGIAVDLSPRNEIIPKEGDPNAYKLGGKSLSEYFQVPFVERRNDY